MSARRIRRALAVIAGLIGLGLVIASMGRVPAGFPLDDAWIHMVYGRALAHGHPMEFHPGEPASGATSPVWVMLIAIVHLALERAGTDATVHGVQALGAIAHVLAAWLAAEVGWAYTRGRLASIAAGVSVGLSPALACAALSGMEASACAAALLAALAWGARGRAGSAGIALALSIGLRPESMVIALGLGAVAIARGERRRVAIAAVPITTACVTIALANLWASGRPLPSTFYLKQEASIAELLPRLAAIALDLLPRMPPLTGCVAFAFALGIAAAPPTQRFAAAVPLGLALAWIVASALVVAPRDPAAFYHQRYFVPALPILLVALAIGAHHAGRRARQLPAVAALAVAVVTAVIGAPAVASRHASDVRNIDEVQRAMGEWLSARTPAGARVAASDVGAVGYFSGRAVVDLMGLNTPGIVWSPETFVAEHPVTHVAYMPAWLRPARSDLIEQVRAFEAERYTVTSTPAMARQIVAVCRTRGRLPFRGIRSVVVLCDPRSRGP